MYDSLAMKTCQGLGVDQDFGDFENRPARVLNPQARAARPGAMLG
jgi:hypothetical protein